MFLYKLRFAHGDPHIKWWPFWIIYMRLGSARPGTETNEACLEATDKV